MKRLSRDRRSFLKTITGASRRPSPGPLALATVLGDWLGLEPHAAAAQRRRRGPAARGAALADLPKGVPKRHVELISTVVDGWTRAVGVVGAVWLLKGKDGSVTALSSVCPHSGCSINQKSKASYGCPCHDSTFELDGKATDGPSPRPMDPLDVQVKDKDVFVKWKRFKIGVKDRQELG